MTPQKLSVSNPAYFDEKRNSINQGLQAIFGEELQKYGLEKLVHAMEYTLMGQGRRYRPLLAVAVYELFHATSDVVIQPACAIELIHTSSLMLDDLPCMDNATVRRGRGASHVVFGESTTILASAALFASAFKLFADIHSVAINDIVGQAADSIGGNGLIKGQFIDVESFNTVQTVEELDACYYLKTAVLFQLSAKLGAVMAEATPDQVNLLERMGSELGLAYQVRDDILDATLTLQQAGKDVKIDAKNGKPTYVSILGLEEATRRFHVMLAQLETTIALLEKQNLHTSFLKDYFHSLALT